MKPLKLSGKMRAIPIGKDGKTIVQARVINDERDASKDEYIDKDEAADLYAKGKLEWSINNQCFIRVSKRK